MELKKILIANRGEIASRAIKTCKRLGIKTLALYALDDRDLLYCEQADEAVYLGFGALQDTYLNQDKIISIAKENGCDGIYPGYGFLSENAGFCKKIEDAGLIFIGPTAEVISLMGDKKDSKQKMEEVGIPLVPGYHGDNQEAPFLKEEALKIGFPVLVKATAGGGGKGMRIVESEGEFISALESAKREAQNAFGSDKVLIEKFITKPRHIEVQIVSDGQGNHFHFFERECSIQRRYQKIIEETPAYGMDEKLRSKICETAVNIAKGIQYRGAGTVEFILDENNEFFFLEMNTRLQVEHPITEMVTGVDLVELQIRAAEGKAFGFSQEDIKQNGHAIEARIYAEDPDNNFLPTLGRIRRLQLNEFSDYRFDCSLKNGSKTSLSYDPMLAKVITHGGDRADCLKKMGMALRDSIFAGVTTNRDYLRRILKNETFINGKYDTNFIKNEESTLTPFLYSNVEELTLCGAGILNHLVSKGCELRGHFQKEVILNSKSVQFNCNVLGGQMSIENSSGEATLNFEIDKGRVYLKGNGSWEFVQSFPMDVETNLIVVGNLEGRLHVKEKAEFSRTNSAAEGSLVSPMPGKIFKVLIPAGKSVTQGEPILVMEAMKMEHPIKANKDGVIKSILFNEGEQVNAGVQLVEME